MDIEFNEWKTFDVMLHDGSLNNVKQFVFELHTPRIYTMRKKTTLKDFDRMATLLYDLETLGFRKYRYHSNPFGKYTPSYTNKTRTCCYEVSYININFLQK